MPVSGAYDTALDRNDMCLVLKLTDGRFSGIFGGDISSEVEKKLVNEYGDELSVDFYKANHHGSKYSSSADWIEALSQGGLQYHVRQKPLWTSG